MKLPEKELAWGQSRSCIRELAEYGWARKAEIGEENVFDFSLGNPSIPAPPGVNEAIAELIAGDSVALHGYTTAAGLMSLREKIVRERNARLGTDLRAERVYVTCGAAAGLAIILHAVVLPGDEVIALAPFFPEYRVFAEGAGAALVTVPPCGEELQPDLDAFRAALSPRTKAVIVNSPNNPSGAVLSEQNLRALCAMLREHEARTGEPVFLISDEPYRELVYDGVQVPCVSRFYDDCVICYSFSKSMSIPGERIGYLAVGSRVRDGDAVYAAVMGAGRSLGYVNPPSLFQRVVEKALGQTADVSRYQANRDALLGGLRALGFRCVEPQGAFYLFMKSPLPDAKAFSELAKRYELLLVPSDDFGCPGYVRLAYCVSPQTIERSLPAFARLAAETLGKDDRNS